jgi:hypothetical protein
MKLTEYKAATLARADVDDIVMIEPVEMRPNADKSGYEQVVHTTESGKTIRKYDVHLMRVVDGIKQFQKEHLAVVNQGLADEEVVFTAKTTEPEVVTESQIEKYVFTHANNSKYQDKKIVSVDTVAPSVHFTGIKDNGDGTASEVRCFAYMKAGVPVTVELTK